MPRAGILAGLPSEQMVGGSVYDRVTRDVATQAGIEQRQQGLDIAQSQEQRQGEKFSLEKEMHPTALRLAQQNVELNDQKFQESVRLAEGKKKVAGLLADLTTGLKAGTLSAEDVALFGINMSVASGNYQGAATATHDFATVRRGEEVGKDMSAFIANHGPLFGEALAAPDDPQKQMALIAAASRFPRAFNTGIIKEAIKIGTENLTKAVPPSVADVLKLYMGQAATVSDAPGKKAIWDKLMADNPEAAMLFRQNPKWVPEDIEAGRKELGEAAKAKAAKEGTIAAAAVTGAFGIEREKEQQAGAERVARIGAESREKVQKSRNEAALEKITQARTVKDAALLVTTTQRELAALLSKSKDKMLNAQPAEKQRVDDEILRVKGELKAYKEHYSRLIASGGKAGELALGEVEGVKPERLSAARVELRKVPPNMRLQAIGRALEKNYISADEAEALRDEVQRGVFK